MNAPHKPATRIYKALLKKDNRFIEIPVTASDRRQAVKRILNWFWYEFKGSLGPAHKALTLNDPYNEVKYGPKFICSDRLNKLLPLDICLRLFKESNGEIVLDRREGSKHHRPNSVRRVKRRRDFGKFIAPNIRKMANGTLYYRITTSPQISHNGRRYRKRKYRDIRLEAKTLEGALAEIEVRQLRALHNSSRKTQVREFDVVAHVAGVIELSRYKRKKFFRAIRRYETPRTMSAA